MATSRGDDLRAVSNHLVKKYPPVIAEAFNGTLNSNPITGKEFEESLAIADPKGDLPMIKIAEKIFKDKKLRATFLAKCTPKVLTSLRYYFEHG